MFSKKRETITLIRKKIETLTCITSPRTRTGIPWFRRGLLEGQQGWTREGFITSISMIVTVLLAARWFFVLRVVVEAFST